MLKYAHITYILACDLQIDADPDLAYHFVADPDPTFQFDADPDPQQWLTVYYSISKDGEMLLLIERNTQL